MKTIIVAIMCFLSFQLHAAACKCNTNPADITLCASQNDTEHPCHAVTPSPSLGVAPIFNACPVTKINDPVTGLPRWVTMCNW
ncbi:hypothetical protein [Legionella waltersii]|uniref:Secreted protein n=2 Tax=Legionella waltersii TaxID=66969 RepID=A0A0W1A0U3_9GAMM|nr:hypothetical protein [Legionella waltersii]KTD74948.1 hypothetical protein Lwal_2989 [Legionella waltersii]SNV08555.1 Uncharacterised protein [Legionella waltersii]